MFSIGELERRPIRPSCLGWPAGAGGTLVMSGRFGFSLSSPSRTIPERITIGQGDTETIAHVALKFLAYLLFRRERLQIEPNLHDANIPFRPDVVQLDYQLRPVLWVECGECSVQKLDKLAVKAPEAKLWVLKRSPESAHDLLERMRKAELRQHRYNILAFDQEPFEDLCTSIKARNDVFVVSSSIDPPACCFDFNGLWFDLSFNLHVF
jgi:uncharacterized protein YaeQ